ncbi:membrane-associated protease-related [Anaeramoeba flamelloides]|uniref:Membrane-associated protease-related n=1 Tax=Anaeramoeba flamelloides TaxID=1746091 RepID=A0AAV7Y364_9EUKA|nr:membrane-associated protease-related [Anaeramoeba flamelloides]KAJ6227835.1 membrane-associated protease-related [Anaeramoeba flamelloides]
MVTTYNNFWKLWSRALIVSAIMYGSFLVLCFLDTLIKKYRKRGGYWSINSVEKKQKVRTLAQSLLDDVRLCSLSITSLLFCLTMGALRRTFTNAAAFDIPQMWWHSLASVIDITFIILFNKFVARRSLKDLGYPAFGTRSGWIPNPKKNLMRLAYVLCICAGTHFITPLFYKIFGCFQKIQVFDYSKSSVYQKNGSAGVFYFFFVQLVCFYINGVDEESHWRGFTKSIYGEEDRKSPIVVYIISGSVYAGVHALNNGSNDIGVYLLVLFNIISEGALWYGLYSTTHDLVGNWYQHDIDDLFSIWFGATSLAGYALPAGQIAPFYIKCKNKWISGGAFGPGGSIIYIFQNLWTLSVILTLRYIIKHYNTPLSPQENKKFETDQVFEEDFMSSGTFESTSTD